MNFISKCLYKYLFIVLLIGTPLFTPFFFVSLLANTEDDSSRNKSEDPFIGKTAIQYLRSFVKEAHTYDVINAGYLIDKRGNKINDTDIILPFKMDNNELEKDDQAHENISGTTSFIDAVRSFATNLHPDKYKRRGEADRFRAIVEKLRIAYPIDTVQQAINILSHKNCFNDYILMLSKMSHDPTQSQGDLLKNFKGLLKQLSLTRKDQKITLFEEAYGNMAKTLAWRIYHLHADNFNEEIAKEHRSAEQRIDEARKEADSHEKQLKEMQKFANFYIEKKGLIPQGVKFTQNFSQDSSYSSQCQDYPQLYDYVSYQLGEMSVSEHTQLKKALEIGRIQEQTSLFDEHLDGRVFSKKESKNNITFHHIQFAQQTYFKELSKTYTHKRLAQAGAVMLILATLPVGSFIYNKCKEYWYDRPRLSLDKDIADLRALEVRSEQPENTKLKPYVARAKRDLIMRGNQLEEQPGNAMLIAFLGTLALAASGSALLYATYK